MDPTESNALRGGAFLLILLLTVLLSYGIRRTGFKWATESSVALLLGIATGGVMFLYFWLLDPLHRLPRRLVSFDEDMFFQVLLPPIIFSAGFSVKKKLFFRNFVTVMLFGVGGTLVTAGALAAGSWQIMTAVGLPRRGLLRTSLALGSVLSCTDSVAALQLLARDRERVPLLYSLLFGEGVVNDATAIVLLGTIANLPSGATEFDSLSPAALGLLVLRFLRLFALSTGLGLGVGCLSAAVVRWLFRRPSTTTTAGSGSGAHPLRPRQAAPSTQPTAAPPPPSSPTPPGPSPDQEVLAVALLGLVAYFLAEGLGLSAVLSVFFCGIAMSHYTWHNLGPAAKMITRHGFHVISAGCEVTLLVSAGLDVWATSAWWRPDPGPHPERSLLSSVALAGGLLALLAGSRAAVTFPLCWAANRLWRRKDPVPLWWGAGVLWWGGLPRGAITLALGYHCFYREAAYRPEQQVVISALILVVVATTVGLGVVTQSVMQSLMPALPPHPPPRPRQCPSPTQGVRGGQYPSPGRRAEPRAAADAGLGPPAAPSAAPSGRTPEPGASHEAGLCVFRAWSHGAAAQAGQGSCEDGPVGRELLRRPLLCGYEQDASLSEGAAGRGSREGLREHRFSGGAAAIDATNELLWMGEVPGIAYGGDDGTFVATAGEAHGDQVGDGSGVLAVGAASGGVSCEGGGGPPRATLRAMSFEGLLLSEGIPAGEEEGAGDGSTWLHCQWRRLDARWLQPLLGGSKTEQPPPAGGGSLA